MRSAPVQYTGARGFADTLGGRPMRPGTGTVYTFGPFQIDVADRRLTRAGEVVHLAPKTFDLLVLLVTGDGRLVGKQQLIEALWPDTFVEEGNLSFQVCLLRKALREDGAGWIQTVAKHGYRFAGAGGVVPAGPAGVSSRRAGLLRTRAALAGSPLLLAAISWWLFSWDAHPAISPATFTQLTHVADSAVAPSLSPDGRMLTFKVGEDFLLGRGQIYVKLLPDGDAVRLTNGSEPKFAPVFMPDGSRVAYSQVTGRSDALSWDTWTVPVLGGQPTRLLPNATGLTWLDDRHVLFAEIRTGLRMGIIAATMNRADKTTIYFPAHAGAMAHYAYASPDRRWVLVVEMDQLQAFTRCRVVPFDGRSPGRQVGPDGACSSAAWAPDGKWMYFGATVAGRSHLWRQRFPDGRPEQITFGPTEQEGVTVAPDGRSLVTAAGLRRSVVWMHDSGGERPVSAEGLAHSPRLSRDARRVYFLVERGAAADRAGSAPPAYGTGAAELHAIDLRTGATHRVLSETGIADYDLSADETQVAFTTTHRDQSRIWVARLDGRSAPRETPEPETRCRSESMGVCSIARATARSSESRAMAPGGSAWRRPA
jgi:Tol biopolymer transport system component